MAEEVTEGHELDEQGHDPAHDPEPEVVDPEEGEGVDGDGGYADGQPGEQDDDGQAGSVELTREELQDAVSNMKRAAQIALESAQRYSKNPTEQEKRAYDKAQSIAEQRKSEVFEKISKAENLDIDPSSAVKEIAAESLDYQKKQGETQKQYEKRLERIEQKLKQQDEREAQRDYERRKANFDSQIPELQGRYEELCNKAYQKVEHVVSQVREDSDDVTKAMAEQMYQQAFEAVVAEARSKAKKGQSDKNGKATSKKSPTGTNPVKNTPSGKGSGPTKSTFERLWGPDSKRNKA